MSLVLLLEFQRLLDGIRTEIASISEKTSAEDLTMLFEQFALKRKNAIIFLSHNIHSMSSYDLKTSQSSLERLDADLAEARDRLIPRKRFRFGQHARKEILKPVENTTTQDLQPAKHLEGLSDLTDVTLTHSEPASSLTLTNIDRSHITFTAEIGALVIRGVRNSQIVAAVKSSVLLTDCQNCTLHLAAQQLRLNNVSDSDFYVSTATAPIFEASHGLRFAPADFPPQFKVDPKPFEPPIDFHWLKEGPSPNWALIPREQYRPP